jgi:hypothetical protein
MPEELKEIEEKPVAKVNPVTAVLIGIILGAGGTVGVDTATQDAQKNAVVAEYQVEQKAEAKVITLADSILSVAINELKDVDIVDSTGKVTGTEKRLVRVKDRNVSNCQSKYNGPLVTGEGWIYTTTTVLSRPDMKDTTLAVIIDRPVADRLHVTYTQTTEK